MRLRVRVEKSRPVRPTRRLELYKLVTQCWPPCNISAHRPPTHPYYYYHHRGHPFHQGKAESRGVVVVYETRYAGGRNAGRRRSCTNVTREWLPGVIKYTDARSWFIISRIFYFSSFSVFIWFTHLNMRSGFRRCHMFKRMKLWVGHEW